MDHQDVTVWICPTPGCSDYVGYGGMPDLTSASATGMGGNQVARGQNFEHRLESAQHTRADCPTCRALGKGRIQRVPVTLRVPRPKPVELVELTGQSVG